MNDFITFGIIKLIKGLVVKITTMAKNYDSFQRISENRISN